MPRRKVPLLKPLKPEIVNGTVDELYKVINYVQCMLEDYEVPVHDKDEILYKNILKDAGMHHEIKKKRNKTYIVVKKPYRNIVDQNIQESVSGLIDKIYEDIHDEVLELTDEDIVNSGIGRKIKSTKESRMSIMKDNKLDIIFYPNLIINVRESPTDNQKVFRYSVQFNKRDIGSGTSESRSGAERECLRSLRTVGFSDKAVETVGKALTLDAQGKELRGLSRTTTIRLFAAGDMS